MSRREIEVLVDQNGAVSIEAIGYQGPDCETATEHIERALGRVQTRKRKPEYHRRQQRAQPLRGG